MELLEITIQTNKLSETEIFYHNMLGLKIHNKSDESISFLAGNSMLTFHVSKITDPIYHFAFNIPCNKLQEAIQWVSTKCPLIEITEKEVIVHFDNWHAKAFYFYDNNGNILEFIARSDLNNNSTDPFNSSSILSVSEIGLVTDHVKIFTDKLMEEKNLSLFAKQPRLENFAALGDDYGLLIVSSDNRNWYPTDTPATKQYVKIRMKNDEKITELIFN